MTSKPNPDQASPRSARGRGVLDPSWEAELLRGREADEEASDAGSIEPELAMLHLLRHAREPESLSPSELDSMWGDISAAVAPEKSSWVTRVGAVFAGQWARWLIPVAGAAALAVIFVNAPGNESMGVDATVAMAEDAASDKAPGAPTAQDAARAAAAAEPVEEAEAAEIDANVPAMRGSGSASNTAALLEQQFTLLEARGRAQVADNVDSQRTSLRSALIGQARGGAK